MAECMPFMHMPIHGHSHSSGRSYDTRPTPRYEGPQQDVTIRPPRSKQGMNEVIKLNGNTDFISMPPRVGKVARTRDGLHSNGFTDPQFRVNADAYRGKDGVWRYKVHEFTVWAIVIINEKNRYQHISEFKPYYDSKAPYADLFNTYEGVLAHEAQHVKEYEAAYKKIRPDVLDAARRLQAPTEVQLHNKAVRLMDRIEFEFNRLTAAEDQAKAAEWKYYHTAYERYLSESR